MRFYDDEIQRALDAGKSVTSDTVLPNRVYIKKHRLYRREQYPSEPMLIRHSPDGCGMESMSEFHPTPDELAAKDWRIL